MTKNCDWGRGRELKFLVEEGWFCRRIIRI